MTTAVERFLKYVSYDTQSDEAYDTCPSTKKQDCSEAQPTRLL